MATMTDVLAGIERVGETQQELKRRLEQLELKEARKGLVMSGSGYTAKDMPQSTRAFLKYLKHGEKRLAPDEAKALVEDSTGQILVAADIEREVFRALTAEGTIRSLATARTTTKDRIQVRTLAGLSAGWGKLETGSLITESDLTPADSTVYVEDLYALSKLGEDEVMDADMALPQIVVEEFRKCLGTMENTAFVSGTGHTYSQPNGIITDATLLAAAETTTAAGAITVEDILTCVYAVPVQYRKGLSIIVHSSTELELRKLRAGGYTASDGPFLWQPSSAEGRPNTFCGWPIFCDDNLGEISGTEEVLAIVGNIREGFRIYDRLNMTVKYLDQPWAEAGLVAWRLHMRVGSYVVRPADKRIVLLKEHA